jgi:hypothetical protein
MRQPLAVLAAILVASAGAVILGEYDLHGITAVVAGAIFGVALAELIVTISRTGNVAMQVAASGCAFLGLVWATWISTGHSFKYATVATWIGIAVGVAAAPLWVRSAGRRGHHNPDAPAHTPGE